MEDRKRKGSVGFEEWVPVSPHTLAAGGVGFSPSAISKYEFAFFDDKKPPESLVIDARKQLSYLGWQIERKKYKNTYRYRYISPDATKIYFSLHQLCHDLRDPIMQSQRIPKPKIGRKKVCMKTSKTSRDDDPKVNQSTLVQCSGKRAKKRETSTGSSNRNCIVLSCLIDNNVVLVGAKVHYRASKCKGRNQLTEGWITRGGIKCNCCEQIFMLTQFEAHAGSTQHRPSENILLEDGRSLLDCIQQLGHKYKRQRISRSNCKRKDEQGGNTDDSDNICSVCREGGDLILCDQCPSSFHTNCIGLEDVPDGDWFCPFCCCNICGHTQFQENFQQDGCIFRCDQCLLKFHVGCARERGLIMFERKNPDDHWFCSNKCEDIFSGLKKLLGRSIVVGADNLIWTLLKPMGSDNDDLQDLSAINDLLDLALEVMHECFEPVKEAYNGRDIVEDVIFNRGSDLNRLNFRGFYTVLLERDDEILTVANVRVLGDKVAEVPFVATRFEYRRLGMCRILMSELEKHLMNLGVERLVLPSASSMVDAWINGFGFSMMTDFDIRRQNLEYNVLNFQGAIMCQKFLRNVTSASKKPW
ncbi:hypothetical protein P3X46_021107 [Hevea brasiliensis]|uniref:PHD-type domain-containing protein n=1 Tax=Hevea brasiliensis TaxID=3981 RepID=A0ABQ9LFK8_HEVBR|nr:increased DNA methylation 1-like [Hevea brasiliensis]KAJ9166335.1 hypothetical protein P3X46_021107 [Hevea brasiliensis]